uniref:Uncharacterized protein n=1 Tax=Knipowitschia caucasica TaxID=637954 RepID=A0AAV2IT13_KNICA
MEVCLACMGMWCSGARGRPMALGSRMRGFGLASGVFGAGGPGSSGSGGRSLRRDGGPGRDATEAPGETRRRPRERRDGGPGRDATEAPGEARRRRTPLPSDGKAQVFTN